MCCPLEELQFCWNCCPHKCGLNQFFGPQGGESKHQYGFGSSTQVQNKYCPLSALLYSKQRWWWEPFPGEPGQKVVRGPEVWSIYLCFPVLLLSTKTQVRWWRATLISIWIWCSPAAAIYQIQADKAITSPCFFQIKGHSWHFYIQIN